MGFKDMTKEGQPRRKWMRKIQPKSGVSSPDAGELEGQEPVSSFQDGVGGEVTTEEFARREKARQAAASRQSVARAPIVVDGADIDPRVSEQLAAEVHRVGEDAAAYSKPEVLAAPQDETEAVLKEAMDRLESTVELLKESREALEAELARNGELQERLHERESLVVSLQDDLDQMTEERDGLQVTLEAPIIVKTILKSKTGKGRVRFLCEIDGREQIIYFPLGQLRDKMKGA